MWCHRSCQPSRALNEFELRQSNAMPFSAKILLRPPLSITGDWTAQELGEHNFPGSVTVSEQTSSGAVVNINIDLSNFGSTAERAAWSACCTALPTAMISLNAISQEAELLHDMTTLQALCQLHVRAGSNPRCWRSAARRISHYSTK
ncbi:uncharacterized protein L969DRAFT_457728 [Mixia osmundae IAM 14324]|uniref:uncharacterized protein n=1 Tax=Mixia osmundae (strain CBS 9802 / IAM 14324 / JCM 22182 / KY 12970) TaxID=764103 RepID=UPI0004A557BB|nr:uncharacterized protein L969DRAFT_457728 [Mixia osmundae IAM 14324]KEI39596.1 hypothetical protein L969DRAFT_457728 [Mixia osmundae IAM 14324]